MKKVWEEHFIFFDLLTTGGSKGSFAFSKLCTCLVQVCLLIQNPQKKQSLKLDPNMIKNKYIGTQHAEKGTEVKNKLMKTASKGD